MIWNVIHPETGQPRINRLILETYNLPWLNERLPWYQKLNKNTTKKKKWQPNTLLLLGAKNSVKTKFFQQ